MSYDCEPSDFVKLEASRARRFVVRVWLERDDGEVRPADSVRLTMKEVEAGESFDSAAVKKVELIEVHPLVRRSNGGEIVQALRQLVRRLEENPAVEVTAKEIRPPARHEALADARDAVPEHLLDVYAQADGFKIAWRFRDDPRSYAGGNGGSLHLPRLAENAVGFETGFEVSNGEPVQLVESTADDAGFERCALTLAGEGVVIFDGDYVCGSFATATDCILAAVECAGTARWLDLFADGVDAEDVRAIVNENRARLGLVEL